MWGVRRTVIKQAAFFRTLALLKLLKTSPGFWIQGVYMCVGGYTRVPLPWRKAQFKKHPGSLGQCGPRTRAGIRLQWTGQVSRMPKIGGACTVASVWIARV